MGWASCDHSRKRGLRTSTHERFENDRVIYGPVAGSAFPPNFPAGTAEAVTSASFWTNSASGRVKRNVTVPASRSAAIVRIPSNGVVRYGFPERLVRSIPRRMSSGCTSAPFE